MYTNILIEEKDQIARVTINRPSFLNALNKETIQELHDAFSSLDTNTNVGVIILTGSGEKSFVAGADIKEFADFTIAQGGELAASGQAKLFDFIENLSKPVIAAVNGFALGGGLNLRWLVTYALHRRTPEWDFLKFRWVLSLAMEGRKDCLNW